MAMYKVWIDTSNGKYGLVSSIKTLDVHWWDEFEELMTSLNDEDRIRLANAFGNQIK